MGLERCSSLPGKRLSTRLGRGQKKKDLLEEGKCQCIAFLLFFFSVGDLTPGLLNAM